MDTNTTSQPAVSGISSSSNGAITANDGATFIINPTNEPSDGEMRQRPPVSASDFNHMFSPLTIEQMFQRCPSQSDSTNTRTSTSIAGMLWRNNAAESNGDGSIASAGDTLKQLLSNGSNPADQNAHYQQHSQPAPLSDNILFSPPDTVESPPSSHEDTQPQLVANVGRAIPRPESARPPNVGLSLSHRRSANLEPRRIPLIPNSPHLRPASRASMISLNSSEAYARRNQIAAHEQNMRGDSSQVPMAQNLRLLTIPPADRNVPATANPQHQRIVHRPAPIREASQVDYYNHPLQIHSAIGPGPTAGRHPADMSLRHEVLDKVARKSQPSTPHDVHIPLPSSRQPDPTLQRPNTASEYGYVYDPVSGKDITMLPGDSRSRAFMWNPNDGTEQQIGQSDLRQQSERHPRNAAIHSNGPRPTQVSRVGSLRKNDHSGGSQARKSSDSSAHLLTPKDFSAPLPDRIGDMVLNKEIGEWVNINDYMPPSRAGSPDSHSTHGHNQQQNEARGPTSQRSSISIHSHMSAFPLPLPTKEQGNAASYGIGLISPVENQRKQVHEMTERKPARRNTVSRGRQIEDEALGSIVQRLMTPVTSPEACAVLDLSGSGIRNLAGLSQITSRLEAISLASNKLQSLAGLPTGLVSLRAPSNWIRFSPSDRSKFMFAQELPHLEEIDLSANEISDVSVFSGLRHLRILDLSRNRIDSLNELYGCRRLSHLRLRDNMLVSFDLAASESPLLTTLDMFNNRLRVVPANIADFSQLAKVNMVKNDLEKIEFHGAAADGIRELRLSENPLVLRRKGGMIDVDLWMAKFPNLKTLYLDVCNVRQLCRAVESMDSRNAQSVALAEEGTTWPSLFNLSLRGNAMRPPLTIDFGCIRNVKNLYTPDTQMTLPRTLPPMVHLLQLVVSNTGLTHLPTNLGAALPYLKLLDISNNPELNDFMPILQLASSLEILKCRAVGFGGLNDLTAGVTPVELDVNKWDTGEVNTFPNPTAKDPTNEQALLKWLSKLRRLRRLDLRFNRCTVDLYAPPPLPAASAVGSGSVLDGALSPQAPGQSVMGENVHSSVPAAAPTGMSRVDEEMWLRQDHTYVSNLKMSRQVKLLQRRDSYWISASRLFPRLEELDGIKIGPH
ncbi:Leucine-rich repeat protein [Coemansia brasiliensis]|uniref:Leucine-rich repeat protein n=1 Tax=Coemansia brasiliensis TaxID=2650707 RepID=A0A9W8M091_9FUNG|nr:Leucine-rich repeat protein [Coemansia brasiliensis]